MHHKPILIKKTKKENIPSNQQQGKRGSKKVRKPLIDENYKKDRDSFGPEGYQNPKEYGFVEREEMFVPYSLSIQIYTSETEIDTEFNIIIPCKGKKVSWLNREFLKKYKAHLKDNEEEVDYSSIHTNFYDNNGGKNNIFQCLQSVYGNNPIDFLLTGYHNSIDLIPANYKLKPLFSNVNAHIIDPLCARAYLKLC